MARKDYPYVSADYNDKTMHVAMLLRLIEASAIVTAVSSITCKAGDEGNCTVWMAEPLSTEDKAILDGIISDYDDAGWTLFQAEKMLRQQVLPVDFMKEFTISSTANGLVITTTINELGIDDETIVVADSSLTKYVLISLCYSEGDGFHVEAFEKTDGIYDLLAEGDYLVQQDISEWSVVANGDTLVEVE
jgi:hypothetical protein